MLRGTLLTSLAFSLLTTTGVALADDGSPSTNPLDAQMLPYVQLVEKCSNTLFMPFYEQVFQHPYTESLPPQSSASSYSSDQTLDHRNGVVYYSIDFFQSNGTDVFPQLDLYFGTDGSLGGSIFGKDFSLVAQFQNVADTKMPLMTYRSNVVSYQIDRYGRIIDLVENLDSVQVMAPDSLADEMKFVNSETTMPTAFVLSGLQSYKNCLMGQ